MSSCAGAGSATELSADAQASLRQHAAPVLTLCLRLAPLEPSLAAATLRKLAPLGGRLMVPVGATDCLILCICHAAVLCLIACHGPYFAAQPWFQSHHRPAERP